MQFFIVCVLFGVTCAVHVQDLDTIKGSSKKKGLAATTLKGELCVENKCNRLECHGFSDWEIKQNSSPANFKTFMTEYRSNRAMCDPAACERDCGKATAICFQTIDMCCCFNAAGKIRNMSGILALLATFLCTRFLW